LRLLLLLSWPLLLSLVPVVDVVDVVDVWLRLVVFLVVSLLFPAVVLVFPVVVLCQLVLLAGVVLV
jgi:hypothetical protein